MDWNSVSRETMLNAMGKLCVPGIEGRYVFDVSFYSEDGSALDEEFAIVVENGKCTWKKGLSGEDGCTPFEVKRGGLETLKKMQVDGLQAATMLMMDGSIYTTNILGAQKWFELFQLGLEPLEKAVEDTIAGK